MNTRKRTTKATQLETLEEDIKEIGALLRGGLSPEDALAAFRRRLDADGLRDIFAALAAHTLLDRMTADGGYLSAESVARMAFDTADAMLRERVST